MSNIAFVYFDIGGVFLEWSKALHGAAHSFGINPEDLIAVFDENHEAITKGNITADNLWEKACDKLSLRNGKGFNLLESWVGDYVPINETYEFATSLVGKYRLGLLSNIYKGMFPLLQERKIVPKIAWDQVVLSCEVRAKKPEKEMFALAEKNAGVDPANILLIDDSESSILGARESGWQAIHFETYNPKQSVQEVSKFLGL